MRRSLNSYKPSHFILARMELTRGLDSAVVFDQGLNRVFPDYSGKNNSLTFANVSGGGLVNTPGPFGIGSLYSETSEFYTKSWTYPTTAFNDYGTSSIPNFSIVFGCKFYNTDQAAGLIHHQGSFGNQLYFAVGQTGVEIKFNSNYAISYSASTDKYYVGAVIKRGSTCEYWLNGVMVGSVGIGSTISGDNSQGKTIPNGGKKRFNDFQYIYNRAISTDEVRELFINPYSIFRTVRQRAVNASSPAPSTGHPMSLRSTTVKFTRQWQPQMVGR